MKKQFLFLFMLMVISLSNYRLMKADELSDSRNDLSAYPTDLDLPDNDALVQEDAEYDAVCSTIVEKEPTVLARLVQQYGTAIVLAYISAKNTCAYYVNKIKQQLLIVFKRA